MKLSQCHKSHILSRSLLMCSPAGIVSDFSLIVWIMGSKWGVPQSISQQQDELQEILLGHWGDTAPLWSVTLSGHQGVRSEERNATLMVCITSPVCGQYIKNISSPHKSNAPVTWGSSDLTLLQCCNSSVSANYKLEFLADHWWGEHGSVDFKWPHLWCLFNI